MDRAEVFIDGFNLYHGMREAGLRPWLWVDLSRLAYLVTPKSLEIGSVNYYTARVREQAGNTREHQDRFISANEALNPTGFRTVTGFMQPETRKCNAQCGQTYTRWTEKRTDVNLAVDLALGAASGKFQVAVLISGDADQAAAVEAARRANVSVIAAFPPARTSDHLKDVANASFVISDDQIRKSQMQEAVTDKRGRLIVRPATWGVRPNFTSSGGPPPPPHFPV